MKVCCSGFAAALQCGRVAESFLLPSCGWGHITKLFCTLSLGGCPWEWMSENLARSGSGRELARNGIPGLKQRWTPPFGSCLSSWVGIWMRWTWLWPLMGGNHHPCCSFCPLSKKLYLRCSVGFYSCWSRENCASDLWATPLGPEMPLLANLAFSES